MAFLQILRHPARDWGFQDPFSILPSDDFDHSDIISSALAQPFGRGGGLNVDWVETPESHVFKADLPGLSKEEIKLEVLDGKILSISGERKNEVVQEKDSWRCVERSFGKFRRQFGLPENAVAEEVAAKVENGVLTITVPKKKEVKKTTESRSIGIE